MSDDKFEAQLKEKLVELYGESPYYYFTTPSDEATYLELKALIKQQLARIVIQLHAWYLQHAHNDKSDAEKKEAIENLRNESSNGYFLKQSAWKHIFEYIPSRLTLNDLPRDREEALKEVGTMNAIKKKLEKLFFAIYYSNQFDNETKSSVLISIIETGDLEQCAPGINGYLTQALNRISDDVLTATIRAILISHASKIIENNKKHIDMDQSVHYMNGLVNFVSNIYGIPKIIDFYASVFNKLALIKQFKDSLNTIDFFSLLRKELLDIAKEKFLNHIEKPDNLIKANQGLDLLNKLGLDRNAFESESETEFDLSNLYDEKDEESEKCYYLKEEYLFILEETIAKRLLFGNKEFLERSKFPIFFKNISLHDLVSTLASNPVARSVFMLSLPEKRAALIEKQIGSANEKECWDALSIASLSDDRETVIFLSNFMLEKYESGEFNSKFSKEYEEVIQNSIEQTKLARVDYFLILEAIIRKKFLYNELSSAISMPSLFGKRALLEERIRSANEKECWDAFTFAGSSGDVESVVFLSKFMLEKYKIGKFSEGFLKAYEKAIHYVTEQAALCDGEGIKTLLADFVTVHKTVLDFLRMTQFYLTSSKKIRDYLIDRLDEKDARIKTLQNFNDSLGNIYQAYEQHGISLALIQFKEKLMQILKETKESHESFGKIARVARFFNKKISPTHSRLAQELDKLIITTDTILSRIKKNKSDFSNTEPSAGHSRPPY